MPITELLEKNVREYPNDICLVEINPEVKEVRRVTWKEYELMEPNPTTHYRREITWHVMNEKANRFANLLLQRGLGLAAHVADDDRVDRVVQLLEQHPQQHREEKAQELRQYAAVGEIVRIVHTVRAFYLFDRIAVYYTADGTKWQDGKSNVFCIPSPVLFGTFS